MRTSPFGSLTVQLWVSEMQTKRVLRVDGAPPAAEAGRLSIVSQGDLRDEALSLTSRALPTDDVAPQEGDCSCALQKF